MGKPKDGGISAFWEPNDILLFCDLCIIEIELGNRPSTHFNKDGWNNLVTKFEAKTGKKYDRIQMKNKWDHLKKEWKLWIELKRGDTGLGWNASRKTIDAPDSWWDERLQAVPATKKFRYAGIHPELEEKMNMMFSSVVATGNHACTPNTVDQPHESTEERAMSVGEEVPLDGSEHVQVGERAKKKRRKGKKKATDTALEDLVESTKVIGRSLREIRKAKCPFTMEETLKKLDTYPNICSDYRFYDFATMFLMDKNHKETFMCLREDIRVRWLRTRYENESH